MRPTYLFYDIETTGLNPCFDQVLQFAAIRTDLALNEIERYEIKARLNPDIIPSPEAVMVHHIGPEQWDQGLPHDQAIQQIHQLLNTPNTISLGYNTLGFDDEFLRMCFYRTLLTPYTHQYANQCSRMDLYPFSQMYATFRPNLLHWPTNAAGNLSLKLEHLNNANNLASGPAHDAMVDVEATLALARLLNQDPMMWDYLCGYFNKSIALQRLQQLPVRIEHDRQPGYFALATHGKLGHQNQFMAPVLSLGKHDHYQNQTLWLRLDTPHQWDDSLSPEKDLFVIHKKMGDSWLLLPPNERFLQRIGTERRARCEENIQWLNQHPTQLKSITHYFRDFTYPTPEDIDPEAALYTQPFPSPEQSGHLQRYQTLDIRQRWELIQQWAPSPHQQMAIRNIGRQNSQLLSGSASEDWQHYLTQLNHCQTAPIDYKNNKKLTRDLALQHINELLNNEELNATQKDLLHAMQTY